MLNLNRPPSHLCPETRVLSLLLALFVVAVVLALVLWLGSVFAQSYFYTEPAGGLFWRGPAAAAVLVLFLLFWSVLNVWGGNRSVDKRIPFPYITDFTNTVDLVREPVDQFESKKLKGLPALYKRNKLQAQVYTNPDTQENWSASGVEWIKIHHDGQEYKFVREKVEAGQYPLFVDHVNGWEMKESRMGIPSYSSFFRVLVYFFLNGMHLLLWVACFWLLLRFSISHALLLGGVLWLAFTLIVFAVLSEAAKSAVA